MHTLLAAIWIAALCIVLLALCAGAAWPHRHSVAVFAVLAPLLVTFITLTDMEWLYYFMLKTNVWNALVMMWIAAFCFVGFALYPEVALPHRHSVAAFAVLAALLATFIALTDMEWLYPFMPITKVWDALVALNNIALRDLWSLIVWAFSKYIEAFLKNKKMMSVSTAVLLFLLYMVRKALRRLQKHRRIVRLRRDIPRLRNIIQVQEEFLRLLEDNLEQPVPGAVPDENLLEGLVRDAGIN